MLITNMNLIFAKNHFLVTRKTQIDKNIENFFLNILVVY